MEAENIVDKKELKGLPIWACILLFIVVFFVFMLLYSALIQGFLSLVLGVEARHPGIVGYILQETGMFLAALTSAVIMLRFERRPFSDLGLSVKGHARGLWYGLLIAVLFYLVGFGLSLLLGEIEVTGFKFESVNLLGSWVFFLLVALFEEILMRGYILGRLLHTRMNKFLSLFISSALFALLHIFNPEIDFLPMLNLLTLHLPEDNVLNGGAFGFEGSLICTVLMIVLTILIVWWGEKREAISLAVPQSC